MGKLRYETSMSLDGFTTGPKPGLEHPLGIGGEQLHEWVVRLASWRESHGKSGGETGPDDDLLKESVEASGAVIMGRRMFSGGSGPWEEDPNADAWWGDEPPFRRAGLHPHPPRARNGGKAGRHHLQLRHRRDRGRAGAGDGGGG